MGAAKNDPYLWALLAALLAGLALGQAARWAATLLGASRTSSRNAPNRRARRAARSARAVALAALAVLAATALLVFPDKAGLSDPLLRLSAAAALGLGLVGGTFPLAAGLPLAALALGAFLFLRSGLGGWIPFGGPGPLGSLLPYELKAGPAGEGSFRGELELAERDSVPVAQEVGLASDGAALAVESLELKGPVGLAATLARGGRSFYRVVGLVGRPSAAGQGPRLLFAGASPLLASLASLGADEGMEPGAAPAVRGELLGLVLRRRATSAAAPIVVLEPIRFSLDADLSPYVERAP